MVEAVVKFKRIDGASTALRTIAEANFAAGTQRVNLRDRLGDLRGPARIIWGEADRIVPASQSRGLPVSIPVTCLPGAGHLVHMEKAEKVNALIKAVAA
jgi:pyruvate dehydrogenase E2 component (dihydrolipoamide acetyltransferase)